MSYCGLKVFELSLDVFQLYEAAQGLSNESLRALRWVSEEYELMKCRVRVGVVLGQ